MGEIFLVSNEVPDLLPMRDRSTNGLHVSTIIKDICLRNNHYVESNVVDKARWELGKALEWAIIQRYTRHFPERYYVPEEIEKDNIFGHPDIIDTCDEIVNDKAIEEIKFTDRLGNESVNLFDPPPDDHYIRGIKFWRDWAQIKSYCWMTNIKYGKLTLCHARGDYKERKVIYHTWLQIFEEEELSDFWEMLTSHRDRMIAEGRL